MSSPFPTAGDNPDFSGESPGDGDLVVDGNITFGNIQKPGWPEVAVESGFIDTTLNATGGHILTPPTFSDGTTVADIGQCEWILSVNDVTALVNTNELGIHTLRTRCFTTPASHTQIGSETVITAYVYTEVTSPASAVPTRTGGIANYIIIATRNQNNESY